ncbi:integrase, catalytic region, zinc finger, CCHC-type containing protein [Tanacetum coccineum]
MNEFDKFEAKEGESLESMYERLSTLVNVMDHNDVRPIKVSINTKFLNSLQPEWSKYVTLTHQNKNLSDVEYDALYDTLLQFEPHVQASKAKRTAKNHDQLELIAHSNAYSSQSHASHSYSDSPQQYYVTHPSSVVDYEEDYQRENQVVIRDGRVDIQTKNAGYGGNGNRNAGRQNRNQAANAENGQCYNYNAKGHYARDCPKPKVREAKYFREQMLLAMNDEAGGTLNDEENDFMLDNSYGDETLEELTVAVIMMAQIQPADDNAETEQKYDAEAVSEVIQLVLWIVDSGCLKHMTGNLQLLRNFVEKFMGIVHFGNDHFAAITGYGDYVQGNITLCHGGDLLTDPTVPASSSPESSIPADRNDVRPIKVSIIFNTNTHLYPRPCSLMEVTGSLKAVRLWLHLQTQLNLALDKCQHGDEVRSKEGKLDSPDPSCS